MEQQFPKYFPLNGSDYFQVFLDRHHRRYSLMGNVSRLVLLLDEQPDFQVLTKSLQENHYIRWMHSLRLKTSAFFRLPRWCSEGDLVKVNLHEDQYKEVEACLDLFHRDINTKKDPPIQFDLVKLTDQWAFVLSWNHILMDARGAELIISQIEEKSDFVFFAKENSLSLSWKERIRHINKVKHFLIPKVKDGIQLLQPKKIRKQNHYKVITFNSSETAILDDNANRFKVGVAKSAFYLAAIQTAFVKICHRKSFPSWVPVPQDQRKKGQTGPVMSNQVSFLFYSLASSESSMEVGVPILRNQMMDQMRDRMTQSYHIMMDSMRRFPAWLYRHLVASPTKGALASYFFSDTGNSLGGLKRFQNCRVNNAVHYPPNSAYPGLTIIFMRYRDCQQIILSYPDMSDVAEKLNIFESGLRTNLLGNV